MSCKGWILQVMVFGKQALKRLGWLMLYFVHHHAGLEGQAFGDPMKGYPLLTVGKVDKVR